MQVRAIDTDASGNTVPGDWSLANNYTAPLFTYSSAPPMTNPPCNTSWMCAAYYVSPVNTSESQTPPVFIWKALTGMAGLLPGRLQGSELLQHPRLHLHAGDGVRAPQGVCRRDRGIAALLGVDPGTQQRWLLLAVREPRDSRRKQVFDKKSLAPAILPPNVSGAGVSFQWSPMIGASFYTLQVSTDESFSNIIEQVNTDSASYTAAKSYPAGQTLYYRVRSNDVGGNGLTWAPGVFARTLAAPVPAAPTGDINPAKLDGVPSWSWSAVPGATAYDVHVDYPSGTSKDANGIHGTTASWTKLDGPGVWHWKVRAEFGNASTAGPYSRCRRSPARSASRRAGGRS